jgi:hypothetical protein
VTVFLWENIKVQPGQTSEYIRGFGERWLPLSDRYDKDLYQISGFFVPDVLNTSHPAARALWTMGSWDTWVDRHTRGTPDEKLEKVTNFYIPALRWRSGWEDKMIESLPWSPSPPVRPDVVRSGSIVIVHRFLVQPRSCAAFAATFQSDVVAAASGIGLHLELFARAIGRPTEYFAFWTIAPTNYVSWRNDRNPSSEDGLLPGFGQGWTLLEDVEEQEMTPAWFSPIAGTATALLEPTEEGLSL